jgi:hypothetical protein
MRTYNANTLPVEPTCIASIETAIASYSYSYSYSYRLSGVEWSGVEWSEVNPEKECGTGLKLFIWHTRRLMPSFSKSYHRGKSFAKYVNTLYLK